MEYGFNKLTAFKAAVFHNNLGLCKELVKLGVDVTHTNNESICWASSDGRLALVKWLVKNGADPAAKRNFPIRSAVKNNHLELARWLFSLPAVKIDLEAIKGGLELLTYIKNNRR